MVRTTNILGDRQISCICQSWGAGQVQQKKTPPHTPTSLVSSGIQGQLSSTQCST